ncbi:uronyl 2-sulfotransferase-like [Apostichopus japonicus]|uniref:uronyl 2-sulfotransferase-like n=1 Tax=Stichopus japonicus TaxID=307972 RepID=UPI003AB75CF7
MASTKALETIAQFLLFLSILSFFISYNDLEQAKFDRISWKYADFKRVSKRRSVSLRSGDESRDKNKTRMYGIPKTGMKYVVIYNAVSKCGSRSLLSSLYSLYTPREVHVDVTRVLSIPTPYNASFLLRRVQSMKTPGFVSGHLPFNIYARDDVVHISMIRNPLERLISLYYFNLYGDAGGLRNKEFDKRWQGKKFDSLEELSNKDGYPQRQNLLWFFTGDERVRDDPERAVALAKSNILNHFIFIGILEEYNASVAIFEKLLPQVMNGLPSAYNKTMTERRDMYRTVNRTTPSTKTIEMLMENDKFLNYEFEIYYFVKQLFMELKKTFQIS